MSTAVDSQQPQALGFHPGSTGSGNTPDIPQGPPPPYTSNRNHNTVQPTNMAFDFSEYGSDAEDPDLYDLEPDTIEIDAVTTIAGTGNIISTAVGSEVSALSGARAAGALYAALNRQRAGLAAGACGSAKSRPLKIRLTCGMRVAGARNVIGIGMRPVPVRQGVAGNGTAPLPARSSASGAAEGTLRAPVAATENSSAAFVLGQAKDMHQNVENEVRSGDVMSTAGQRVTSLKRKTTERDEDDDISDSAAARKAVKLECVGDEDMGA